MVSLRAILGSPGLGLSLVAGDGSTDVDVLWAHVSELDDPTPWLEGGELLLTTGLTAAWGREDAGNYCQRLLTRGIAALGVSVGPDLTYPELPATLRDAATATGLRLILVPHLTPLKAVVRTVADSISAESTRPLRSLVDAQRRLMSEAATGSGIQGTIERLQATAGLSVAVYDIRLRLVTDATDVASPLTDDLRQRIRRQILRDIQGSLSIQAPSMSHISLPLVTEGKVRGFAVASQNHPFATEARAVLKVAAPILALLLELHETAHTGVKQQRARLFQALVSESESEDGVAAILCAAELSFTTTCVIRARTQSVAQRRAFTAGATDFGRDTLVQNDDDHTTIIVCDPVPSLVEHARALVDELGMNGVGVGDPGPIEHTVQSLGKAVRAQTAARNRGEPFATAPDNSGKLIGILTIDDVRLAAFPDDVLGPIDAHDRANPRHELLPALRAYFESIASIEAAAATLQIHRHTIRARLQRVCEISGRDLSDSSQYLELWLAVELRRHRQDGHSDRTNGRQHTVELSSH